MSQQKVYQRILSRVAPIPQWSHFTFSYTDVKAASTTNTITLFPLPAKSKVIAGTVKASVAFSGGAISAVTMSIGGTVSVTDFMTAFDIQQAVGDTVYSDMTANTSGGTMAAQTVSAVFTSVGANLSALTQGTVEIWVLWSQLP